MTRVERRPSSFHSHKRAAKRDTETPGSAAEQPAGEGGHGAPLKKPVHCPAVKRAVSTGRSPATKSHSPRRFGAKAKDKKATATAAPETALVESDPATTRQRDLLALAAISSAIEYRTKNPAPRLKLSQDADGGNRRLTIGEAEDIIGQYLLREAICGQDDHFFAGTIQQMAGAATTKGVINEDALNYMLSFVIGKRPQDQTEVMMDILLASTYLHSMSFAAKIRNADTLPEQDSATVGFKKMSDQFIKLDERFSSRRSVAAPATVQNVCVNGGQAIVAGSFSQAPAETSPDSSPPALTHAPTEPMVIIDDTQVNQPAPSRRGK